MNFSAHPTLHYSIQGAGNSGVLFDFVLPDSNNKAYRVKKILPDSRNDVRELYLPQTKSLKTLINYLDIMYFIGYLCHKLKVADVNARSKEYLDRIKSILKLAFSNDIINSLLGDNDLYKDYLTPYINYLL